MTSSNATMRTLVEHFFRRFFDNDTVHVQGETLTTVVRALSAVAVPGLMGAFFLQNQYPGRPLWGAIEDQYFFVLFSFVTMGAVAVFEWEMLFPDRLDFLVLTPLSLKGWQLLTAKVIALAGFLALFLGASTVFGTVVLPAVSKGDFYRQVLAHAAATLLAGTFAALALLGVGGAMLCGLDPRRFRAASPLLQMAAVTALGLLLMHYLRYGDGLRALLAEPLGRARWVPPYWFLGVYEVILRGSAAPPFAAELARYAYEATALAGALVLVTYPLAWARMQRLAIEGVERSRRAPRGWFRKVLQRAIRRPGERAVFAFIGKTMGRTAKYQVYLAIYGGVGLALSVACAVEIWSDGVRFWPALSHTGLHALLPLLLFWVVAGLRTAFAFPLNLSARWIFRLTGAQVTECADAGRHYALGCALAVVSGIVALDAVARWDGRQLLVQAVCGVCLALVLTDAFFFSKEEVPFSRPRMPGRANFPLTLTLYVAVFPMFVMGVKRIETSLESHLWKLLWVMGGAMVLHSLVGRLRYEPKLLEEELEGYDEEFQLLGLS